MIITTSIPQHNTEETATELRKAPGVPFKKGDDNRRNLDGRPPKEFSMTNVMREVLNIEDKETRIKNYEAILIAAVEKAKAGDNDMIKYIINRLEGMPKGESTTNVNVVIPILGGNSVKEVIDVDAG